MNPFEYHWCLNPYFPFFIRLLTISVIIRHRLLSFHFMLKFYFKDLCYVSMSKDAKSKLNKNVLFLKRIISLLNSKN